MKQMKDFPFGNSSIRVVAEEVAFHIQDYYNDHCKCEPNDFQLKSYVKSIVKFMIYELDNSKEKRSYRKYLQYRSIEICGDSFSSRLNYFSDIYKKDGDVSQNEENLSHEEEVLS